MFFLHIANKLFNWARFKLDVDRNYIQFTWIYNNKDQKHETVLIVKGGEDLIDQVSIKDVLFTVIRRNSCGIAQIDYDLVCVSVKIGENCE